MRQVPRILRASQVKIPGEYRRWRRRAELYLLGLPTNVPEKKWGARLIEHLTGEAGEVVEFMSIEEITKDNGWKLVFKALDEKYKELDKHELQRVMKEYFYTINIKEGESYGNFIIRLETAYKGLVRHDVTLPDEVKRMDAFEKNRHGRDRRSHGIDRNQRFSEVCGDHGGSEVSLSTWEGHLGENQDERDLHGQRRG